MRRLSADTNILLYALHEGIREHRMARETLNQWASSTEFVIGELVLAELYQLLRNPLVFGRDLSSGEAVNNILLWRHHSPIRLLIQCRLLYAWPLEIKREILRTIHNLKVKELTRQH